MEDERVLLKFLSQLKHKWVLLVLAVVGVALVAVGGSLADRREGKAVSTATADVGANETYRRALEAELTALVGSMEGVGRVQVMITLKEGEAYSYSGGKLVGTVCPRVEGVAVLCQGGGNDRVQKEVADALSALLDVGVHKIYVGKLT